MIYTGFAYSGWNASCYILEEVKQPRLNIARSLLIGTGIVTLLYLMLNMTFLAAAPLPQLVGKIEVAYTSGQALLGTNGGYFIGLIICLALITSASFVNPGRFQGV